MNHKKAITVLVLIISVLAAFAAGAGIFSTEGPGPSIFETVHGRTIMLYGRGLYRHMSAEVAPQGIAQDYVTLFVGIPLLWISLLWARKGSLRGRFMLAGVVGYFFVTYLFYLMMGMYNALFLAYAALLASSFFALALILIGFDVAALPSRFGNSAPVKSAGAFLVFTTFTIGLLWLSIVVPPLLAGMVFPPQVEHYTTLVVQGLDLGLLLPLGLVSGILLIRKKPFGYLLAPTYLVFLSLLMTALTVKIAAMGLLGYNIFPVVFIIPAFNILSVVLAAWVLKSIDPGTA